MNKRIVSLLFTVVIIFMIPVNAHAFNMNNIEVSGFDNNVDYYANMMECLNSGNPYALFMGKIYETQRNMKIIALGLESQYPTTRFFLDNDTIEGVKAAIEESKKPKYTEEDLYWLSKLVAREMGANWVPDQIQRDVASVVINNSKLLNKSIKDTVHTPGKYGGIFFANPTQKVTNNCIYVLENGPTLPSYVIGQSNIACGPVYKSYYDPYMRNTTYFWYQAGTNK